MDTSVLVWNIYNPNKPDTQHDIAQNKFREEFNNSSPNKQQKQGQGQPLVYDPNSEVILKTYNYFRPGPKEKSLGKNSSKKLMKHSPRFEGESLEKSQNDQSFYSGNQENKM